MEKKKFISIFMYVLLAGVLGLYLFLGYGALPKKSLLIVEKSTFSRPVNSQYGRFQGEVMLPAQGYWQIAGTKSAGNITEMYLVPTAPTNPQGTLLPPTAPLGLHRVCQGT